MIADVTINEKMLLGCLLRSPHEYWQIADIVQPESFIAPAHRAVFSGMRSLADLGRIITVSALLSVLPEELEDAGATAGVVMALKASAEEAGSATDYAPFLAETAARRRLASLSEWLRKQVGDPDHMSEEIAGEASARLQAIMTSATPRRPVPVGEVAARVAKRANAAQSGEFRAGITTGISTVDAILGLILPGDLGFILAAQAEGKSALAAQIAMHAAQDGRPVLFVQMEMSDEQMAARELSRMTDLSVSDIDEGAFDVFQWEQLIAARNALEHLPFHILDTERATVRQIRAQAVAMKAKHGLGLIVIDQLDKIQPEGKHRDRFEAYRDVTGALKDMAKGLSTATICLAQRTRTAQRRNDPTPGILDSDAPSMERDGDWVLALWQRSRWLEANRPDPRGGEEAITKWQQDMLRAKDLAEAITLKHRRRKPFQTARMHFDGRSMTFSEPR